MKRKIFLLMLATAILAAASSCSRKDNPYEEDDNKQEQKDPDSPGEETSQSEQAKAALGEAVDAVIKLVDTDELEAAASFFSESIDTILGCKPDKACQDWIESVLTSENPIRLSSLTGFLTVTDSLSYSNTSVKSDGGLSFTYTLKDGTAYTATATITDTDTVISIPFSIDEYEEGDEDDEEDGEITLLSMYLPASIQIDFAQGNTPMGEISITPTFTDKNGNKTVDPADELSLKADVSYGEYKWTLSEAKYSTKEAAFTGSFAKKDTTILSGNLKASGNLAFDEDGELDEKKSTFGTAEVSADLLDGQVKFSGTGDLSAIVQIVETVEKTGLEEATEAQLKAYAAAIEKALAVNVYFSGSATPQARLGAEVLPDGDGGYELTPVLRFDDGSTYNILGEFFSVNDLASILGDLQPLLDLIDEIEALFDSDSDDSETSEE